MHATALAAAGIFARVVFSLVQTAVRTLGPAFEGETAWAEWLAWLILTVFVLAVLEKDTQSSGAGGSWKHPYPSILLAALLVFSQWSYYSVEDGLLSWSLPLITILTYVTFKHGRGLVGTTLDEETDYLPLYRHLTLLRRNVQLESSSLAIFIGISLMTSFIFMVCGSTLGPLSVVAGLVHTVMIAAIYVLIRRESPERWSKSNATHNSNPAFQAVPVSALVMSTAYLVLGLPLGWRLEEGTATVLGFMRVAEIVVTVLLVMEGNILAASTLDAAATSVVLASQSGQFSTTLILGMVSLAMLSQTASVLPKSATGKPWLLLFLLLPARNLLGQTGWGGRIPFKDGSPAVRTSYTVKHPIEELVQINSNKFERMLESQSKTLPDAITEYRRRYGGHPPPGFDRWFEIALARDYQFIDEFDIVMRSLEPYWGVSPALLRARMRSLDDAPHMVRITVQDNVVTDKPEHTHARLMREWYNASSWGEFMPNLDFRISNFDEPRVVAPYDTVALAMENAGRLRYGSRQTEGPSPRLDSITTDVEWLNTGQQDGWAAMLSSCQIGSPSRSEVADEVKSEASSHLDFVSNVTLNQDLCKSTDRLGGHGFLTAPASLTATHQLVPLFAQCKPSVFNDILYPTNYYVDQIRSGDYDESKDPDWNDKQDRVYWTGSSTGGFITMKNWKDMPRQRLTLMTTNNPGGIVNLLRRAANNIWESYESTWAHIEKYFYLRITNIVQCDDDACEVMKEAFPQGGEHEGPEAALSSKYALDIDGNGYSGRYYRLLKSKMAVLKHTIFQEWHDDRLVPWVHFIPVSAGANELGEIMRFLIEDPSGKEIGKNIAAQGREWAWKALREDDLEINFMRLLLEYARIMDDDRVNMAV